LRARAVFQFSGGAQKVRGAYRAKFARRAAREFFFLEKFLSESYHRLLHFCQIDEFDMV